MFALSKTSIRHEITKHCQQLRMRNSGEEGQGVIEGGTILTVLFIDIKTEDNLPSSVNKMLVFIQKESEEKKTCLLELIIPLVFHLCGCYLFVLIAEQNCALNFHRDFEF